MEWPLQKPRIALLSEVLAATKVLCFKVFMASRSNVPVLLLFADMACYPSPYQPGFPMIAFALTHVCKKNQVTR
jgi:hypothetical protein